MKHLKLLFITLLLCTLSIKAQDNDSNNITVITAPGAYGDGFNIGIQYEHQWDLPYVGVEVFYFPNLHDITYTHLIVRFGVGQELGNPVGNKWRWNTGFRGGRVFRDGYDGPFALLGLEIGIQLTLPCGLFGKLVYAKDMKSDSAIWNRDNHIVNSVFSGIGVRF